MGLRRNSGFTTGKDLNYTCSYTMERYHCLKTDLNSALGKTAEVKWVVDDLQGAPTMFKER